MYMYYLGVDSCLHFSVCFPVFYHLPYPYRHRFVLTFAITENRLLGNLCPYKEFKIPPF